jgi:receptor protein-tyrosine kinase
MSWQHALSALRAQAPVLLVAVLAGLLGAVLLTWTTVPRYASSVGLFVAVTGQTDAGSAYEGNLFTQQRTASYAELLTGTELAGTVVDELGLAVTPAQLAADVTATALPGTVVLDVQVTDTDPVRAQAVAASLTRAFTARVAELETPPGSAVPTVRVETIRPADLQTTPVSAGLSDNLPRGAALGLLAGVLVAVVRDRRDTSVREPDDVRAAGVDLLGQLPDDPGLRRPDAGGDRPSPAAGTLRSLGARLRPLDGVEPRVVLVTSPLPGEGKSTVAVQLAVSLARGGRRVVLVDGNLWRPRVDQQLGLPGGTGLSDVLAGRVPVEQALQPWGSHGLVVLPAGPLPAEPGDLLSGTATGELLHRLRQDFDLVVVDAPPVLAASDASVLAAACDGCLLVVRWGRTRSAELVEAVDALVGVRAVLLGAVLTRVPARAHLSAGVRRGYRADPGRRQPPRAADTTPSPVTTAAAGGGPTPRRSS